jgi:protein-S-isoprenylcysteine O-methyltransferase Ste14
MAKEITTTRIFIRITVLFLLSGAIFFGTAGTLKWVEAWLYLILAFSCTLPGVIWMKKNDPKLLKDRMGFEKKSPQPIDRFILLLYLIFVIILCALPGLDAVRFHWSTVPVYFKVFGFILLLSACFIFFRTIKANPYLSSIVEVHEDREHKVATTGPYKYIRHPWYLGLIMWFFCVPLILGSLYSLIPAVVLTLLIVIRTFIEEKTLRESLPGYKEYLAEVKYRIIPYIW